MDAQTRSAIGAAAEAIGPEPTMAPAVAPQKDDHHDVQHPTDEHHDAQHPTDEHHDVPRPTDEHHHVPRQTDEHHVMNAFTKIQSEIDKMIAECSKQQDHNSQLTGWADDEFDPKNLFIEMGNDLKDLFKSIQALTANVAETQVQMKRASEIREADDADFDDVNSDNADFQQTVADQLMARRILKQALLIMNQVHGILMSQKCFTARR